MKNNKTHQLVILNSIQDLQRLSLVLINSMRGRFQIKFGMTSLFNDSAFTLIELLVVVLIIGILAAVAVPQYQKAVEKSKATQAKTLAKSAYQAAQTYKLANGNWPTKFEELAIEIPWTGNTKVTHASYHKTLSNDDWSLVLTHSDAANGIWVIHNSGKYANAGFVILENNMVSNGKTVPGEQLLCVEGHSSNGFITSFQESHQTGDYCKKIIGGTEIMTTSAHRYFTL